MTVTLNWTEIQDQLVCEAFRAGRVTGELNGVPDEVVESGLAHIFFYGDKVFKLYKTHSDKDHFIKKVLAPTKQRVAFLEHDFTLNKHFSGEVYLKLHGVHYADGIVNVTNYRSGTIYALTEMYRLDFDTNLHERLLRGDIVRDELVQLGYETARAIDTCPIGIPANVNWYTLAKERLELLRQFLDWLPEEYSLLVKQTLVIEAFESHLERHRVEYEQISGSMLSINMDNHDENVFFINGKPQFIDLLPPMQSWWYGLAHANLANLMVNIETLHSLEAAEYVKEGYVKYNPDVDLTCHSFGFTRAFAHLISIAHFGSVPEKHAVTKKYLARISEIHEWL